MPAKGIREAKRKTRRIAGHIADNLTERTLTELLIVAQGYSTLMTPAEYGNLRNSQYRIVRPYNGGIRGQIGYTANYAAAVHNASGKLRGTPRKSGNGNYWDPAGEPQFLSKAFEGEGMAAIDSVVRRGMKI